MTEIPASVQQCHGLAIRRDRAKFNFQRAPRLCLWRVVMTQSQKFKMFVSLFLGLVVSFSFSVWTSQFVDFPPLRCLHTAGRTNVVASVKDARPNHIKRELLPKQFIFIAVMTSEKYITTRARGVWETWGRNIPGRLVFFTGRMNHSSYYKKDMPIIQLDVQDDAYPPQRKSFIMLKYVYENFLQQYEWFIRADDDVYMRIDRLDSYLKQLDSSEDLVIGQPGVGNKREVGKLGLGKNDNFCIGGPGVIMTSNVLRMMGPHLLYCLNETASFHEDVEVGRCIRRFGGVMCPWGYEAREIFHQIYDNPLEAYHGSLNTLVTEKAINFHPVKDPAYMRRMHVHFGRLRLRDLLLRKRILDRKLKNINSFLDGAMHWANSRRLLSDPKDYEQRDTRNSSQLWERFDLSKVWAVHDKAPLRYIHYGTEVGLTNMVDFSKEILIRDGEKHVYEALNFDKWHTGYMKVDPRAGTEFVVNIGTKYQSRDALGKVKMTRVRRSVRLRQNFEKFAVKCEGSYGTTKETLHFVVPLMERLDNFKRFLKSFEEEFLAVGDPVKLLIVYFPDVSSPVEQKKVFKSYTKKYPSVEMKWIDVKGPFKRAVALQMGTDFYGNTSLLYYCDVDLVFRREFADRCRANAVLGKRAYFPVMFSQFNPDITYVNKQHPGTHYYYAKGAGFWRWYSFGPVCAYSKDINDSGGLNTKLLGWGMEDVDLYEKFVKRTDIEIFRAPDPGLVHVYHPHAACESNSNGEQQAMCRAAQADLFSSAAASVDYLNAKGYLGNLL